VRFWSNNGISYIEIYPDEGLAGLFGPLDEHNRVIIVGFSLFFSRENPIFNLDKNKHNIERNVGTGIQVETTNPYSGGN
jgi:hypothetical protein